MIQSISKVISGISNSSNEAVWNNLAEKDAYWTVLSDDSKKGNWKPEEFYASGHGDIQLFKQNLNAIGINIPKGRALDFGCGLGRLTYALSECFEEAHGVDISSVMIEKARSYKPNSNAVFHHNVQNDLSIFSSNSYDLVFSKITLQHIPTSLALNYINEFCRILKPSGILYIQTPTWLDCSKDSARDKILRDQKLFTPLHRLMRNLFKEREQKWEVYYHPLSKILKVMELNLMNLRSISSSENPVGGHFISHTITAEKVIS